MDTPDLDAYFGPKEQDDPVVLRQYKHDWRCEDRIKGALDAFFEVYWEPHGKTMKRSLMTSARHLLEEVSEAEVEEFIHWSRDEVRKRSVDIKDLRSLVFLIPAWRKQSQKQDYLSGWDVPADDPGDDLVQCPRCQEMVTKHALDLPCKGNHYIGGRE